MARRPLINYFFRLHTLDMGVARLVACHPNFFYFFFKKRSMVVLKIQKIDRRRQFKQATNLPRIWPKLVRIRWPSFFQIVASLSLRSHQSQP